MTMPGYRTYAPPAPPKRSGMARTVLILGIAGLAGLALCLVGILPALAGLILGTISLLRGDTERGLAVAGMICSAIALILGSLALSWLLSKAAQCGDASRYPTDTARRSCVEREFPYAHATPAP
ncbi:DUF4190 domain-containing protein [Actinomadura graeca]|uniref:DUF4190 domain-containing protein n=1 Tax=Actinomadura graeca TaxID=2750812 RepID=A0ABX8QVH3_9ACTN|nr:DUF4190 domain-containing protein [Actinomadura graeca]QXJ22727.1 DUF4190 domain-containing protein [Actinomadura graeca]